MARAESDAQQWPARGARSDAGSHSARMRRARAPASAPWSRRSRGRRGGGAPRRRWGGRRPRRPWGLSRSARVSRAVGRAAEAGGGERTEDRPAAGLVDAHDALRLRRVPQDLGQRREVLVGRAGEELGHVLGHRGRDEAVVVARARIVVGGVLGFGFRHGDVPGEVFYWLRHFIV